MQIDWITIAAQIVNFLILVWLLNRVLFRPLAKALDERAEAVRRQLAETETAQARARAAEAGHHAALQAFEDARAERLSAVEAEAEALHHRLTVQARDEVAARRRAGSRQLEAEKTAFLDRLRRRASAAFVTLARNALAEMSDRDLLDQMARVFARRLASLPADERAQLAARAGAGEPVEVLTSLDLSPAARSIVAGAVAQLTGARDPGFRTDPGLECGVMLAVGSRHVGWTLGEHLDAFEDDIAALFADQRQHEGLGADGHEGGETGVQDDPQAARDMDGNTDRQGGGDAAPDAAGHAARPGAQASGRQGGTA